MAEINLRNKDIIASLDSVKDQIFKSDFFREKIYNIPHKDLPPDCRRRDPEDQPDPERFLSPEYLNRHMNDPDHQGYPVEHFSIPMGQMAANCDILEKVNSYANGDFIAEMGGTSSAVFLYYPPGGFVGWHTNQNNSGWQFIFSWSEKGDGYFQYYDKKKEEIVRLPDVAGWNARHYHFGEDVGDHCWHSAYTNVPRITICVLFRWREQPDKKDDILELKDQLILDLETE